MALCATTALAGAVSRLCVRGARGRFGGGSGRYLVLCLSCFPLPAPRVPRCVWRAVPSGCPLPSLAGTPFHAVCAFRALGPVALPVVPACPFRVCALALSRCPGTHAHTARRSRKRRGASGAPTKPHTSQKQTETEAQPRTPQIADTRGTTPQIEPKNTHPKPQPGQTGLTKPAPNRQPDPNTNTRQQ